MKKQTAQEKIKIYESRIRQIVAARRKLREGQITNENLNPTGKPIQMLNIMANSDQEWFTKDDFKKHGLDFPPRSMQAAMNPQAVRLEELGLIERGYLGARQKLHVKLTDKGRALVTNKLREGKKVDQEKEAKKRKAKLKAQREDEARLSAMAIRRGRRDAGLKESNLNEGKNMKQRKPQTVQEKIKIYESRIRQIVAARKKLREGKKNPKSS